MRIIKGDLVLTEDTTIDDDLIVEGNIRCEGGLWNLECRNLDSFNVDCCDLTCRNLDCRNLDCWVLNCNNLSFFAIAIAYFSFKCKSWEAHRDNYIIKCLDGEIEIKKSKFCNKCGQEIKNE